MILIVVIYVNRATPPMYQAQLCSQYSSVTKCKFGDFCTLCPPGVEVEPFGYLGFSNLQFEISLSCLFSRYKVLFFRGIISS